MASKIRTKSKPSTCSEIKRTNMSRGCARSRGRERNKKKVEGSPESTIVVDELGLFPRDGEVNCEQPDGSRSVIFEVK